MKPAFEGSGHPATNGQVDTSADDGGQELRTRSGLVLHVRPARPEDEPALEEFFSRVTPEDLRFRFLAGVREVSHQRLVEMTQVDHRLTENLLAFASDKRTILASAMLAFDPAQSSAEVAISIRSDHKHRGVGWEMLRHAARCAERKGAKWIESVESRENHEAIELEREQGFVARPYPDDASLLLIRKELSPV